MKDFSKAKKGAQSITDASPKAGATEVNFPAPQQSAAIALPGRSAYIAAAKARVQTLLQYFPNVTACIPDDFFSFHDFLEIFIVQHSREYREVVERRGTGDRKKDAFLVHSDISVALANSGLVNKVGNVEGSPNVFGGVTRCSRFKKGDS